MAPLPLFYTEGPSAVRSVSTEQIDQLNEFFGSTLGIITFSLIWIVCVVAMFFITGYALVKSEKEAQLHPEIAKQKAENGTLLLTSAVADLPFETHVSTFSQYLSHGKYYRMV